MQKGFPKERNKFWDDVWYWYIAFSTAFGTAFLLLLPHVFGWYKYNLLFLIPILVIVWLVINVTTKRLDRSESTPIVLFSDKPENFIDTDNEEIVDEDRDS